MLHLACATYPIDRLPTLEAWRNKLSTWVEEAAHGGAQLLVFPEYAGMELAGLISQDSFTTEQVFQRVAEVNDLAREHYRALCRRHNLYLLAPGTVWQDGGAWRNACELFSPEGDSAVQYKSVLTPWERSHTELQPGKQQRLFDTAVARLGVLVCYDVQFPELARELAQAGAELILVPACTDTPAGAHRIQIAAAARALENQCVVATSSTTGSATWNPVVDSNHGWAAVYGPADVGFPDSGVIARGSLDAPGWVFSDIKLESIQRVREHGHVRGLRDAPQRSGGSPERCVL